MRAASFATLAAGLVLLAPMSASAQVPLEARVGLELLTSGFDATTANTQGVGSRGWGAQFNVELSAFRVLMARADVGAFSVKDKRSFTEGTTQGDLASSAGGELGTLAAGLRTPRLAVGEGKSALQVSASAAAGHTWIAAKRGIDRCIDCTVEDVEMDGGDFWEAGLEVGPRARWAITARYRTYRETSDFRDAVLVGWSMRVGRRSAEPRNDPAAGSEAVP